MNDDLPSTSLPNLTPARAAADTPSDATHPGPAGAADEAAPPPPGFKPLHSGGDFIDHNGPLYIRTAGGVLQLGFRVGRRHCNPMGICHGGMLASFADMLLPISAQRSCPQVGPRFLPTISLQLDYLAPATLGAWVQGEAQTLRVTRSLCFVQGLVTVDGTPALRASGVFKLGPPWTPPSPAAGP